MTRTKTFNELYSVDLEFPGGPGISRNSVLEIGAENAEEAAELLASYVRPGTNSSSRASKERKLPGPALGPTPVPHSLCLDEDFQERREACEERCSVAHEKSDEVSKKLRQALLCRGPLVSRPGSRAEAVECSTRATSRATTRGESRLSMRGDSKRTVADSRQSDGRGDSRLSMRADSRLSARTDSRLSGRMSVDSCFESLYCPPQPPHLGQSLRQPCQTEAGPPLPQSPRRHPARPSRMEEPSEVQKRKRLVNDDDFLARNRENANNWMIDCNPHGAVHHSQKEPWVIAKEEREAAELAKRAPCELPETMGFEDWLEDVREVEHAVFGCSRYRYEQLTQHSIQATQEEAAILTLQQMSNHTNRGKVSKHDRDIAQQVALARLRRQWGKNTDYQKSFDQLGVEIRNGSCTLVERRGMIMRLVSVVVFKITYKGTILTDIGHWHKGKGYAAPRLPGEKTCNFERVEDTTRHMMSTFMAPLQAGLELGEIEYCEYTEKSESCGIPTFYQKSVQHAEISAGFELPALPLVDTADSVEISPEFRQYRAFCLRQRNKLKLFVWLKPADFETIFRPEARGQVALWINHMSCDEATAVHDLSWTLEKTPNPQEELARKDSFMFGLKRRFKTAGTSSLEKKEQPAVERESISLEACLKAGQAEKNAAGGVVEEVHSTRKSICAAARELRKVMTQEMRTTHRDSLRLNRDSVLNTMSAGAAGGLARVSALLEHCQEEVKIAAEKRSSRITHANHVKFGDIMSDGAQ